LGRFKTLEEPTKEELETYRRKGGSR